jgi:hypothetical protein
MATAAADAAVVIGTSNGASAEVTGKVDQRSVQLKNVLLIVADDLRPQLGHLGRVSNVTMRILAKKVPTLRLNRT